MKTDTLIALWRSIEHWHNDIWANPKRAAEKMLYTGDHCALCHLFCNQVGVLSCMRKDSKAVDYDFELCPIAVKTGHDQCRDTPWASTAQMVRQLSPIYRTCHPNIPAPSVTKVRQYIEREIAFLVDLLPEPDEKYHAAFKRYEQQIL